MYKMIFILSNIIGCLSLTSCFYQETEQQAADLAKKPVVFLSQSHSKNNYEFNEVAYDIMHNQFIAVGGKKDGRPLIVSSPDGLIWTQHNIAIPGKVTSMLITQNGNLFIDIEEPGTTDSSVYQVELDFSHQNWAVKKVFSYPSYEKVVKSIQNNKAIYELRTMGNGVFRLYRIPIDERKYKHSNLPQLIYTGEKINDIACSENDRSVTLLTGNGQTLISKSPEIPNSFHYNTPGTTDLHSVTLSLAGGQNVVSKINLKSESLAGFYAYDPIHGKWQLAGEITESTGEAEEFIKDIDLSQNDGRVNDEFIDIDRSKNNKNKVMFIIGSISNKGAFKVYSYPKELPNIAPRTCAAGAIINGKHILVLMGNDNNVLYSRDNVKWEVITLLKSQ